MSPVRIRIWLKNGEFLKTSIDFDDVMAINKAHGKVKAGVIRNENLKITISNITFHFDDIEEAMCCYDYQYTDHSISTVTIEERDVIKEELNKVYCKVDNFINKDIKKSVPEGKEHFLGIGGAILAILNTLLFPVYTITGFFGFGGGGANFFQMNALYMLFGLAFLAFAGANIYASLNRDMKILQIQRKNGMHMNIVKH